MVRIAIVSMLKMMLAMLFVKPRIVLSDEEARLGSFEVTSFNRSEMWYLRSSSAKYPLRLDNLVT